MKRKHAGFLFKIIIVIAAIISMAGCVSFSPYQTGSEEAQDYSEEVYLENLREQETQEQTVNRKRVGVAMPTRSSERWINDGINMKAKLEALGYEVDLQYANDDIDLQISQIDNMIKNGANCLVVSSIDSTQLTGILGQAKLNGIPVIAYDRLLMDTDAVYYYATFDNRAVGTLIGQYIVEKKNLKQAAAEGKSYTIEFFMGSPDDNNAVFLYQGLMEELLPYLEQGTLVCKSGLTAFEDTCILRWSEDTAKQRCDQYLKNYYQEERLDIACSAFDPFAYGIMQSCLENGYTETDWPMITGQDAEIPGIRNIENGFQTMTIYKDTRVLASKCVTMVQAVLENIEPEINDTKQYNNNVMTVPSYLCVPVAVDRDNYEKILIKGGYYTKEQLFEVQ